MDLSILEEVLTGDLRPWLSNDVETIDGIKSRLHFATTSLPETNTELVVQLTDLLSGFPNILPVLQENNGTPNQRLVHHFYDIEIPLHTNSYTQFYYLFAKQETLRIFNSLINYCADLEAPDTTYQVRLTMKYLRVLAIQINDTIDDKGFRGIPDASTNQIHYALYVLKLSVIMLFLEIQAFYDPFLKSNTNPKTFFHKYLNEPYTTELFKPNGYYYKNALLQLIHTKKFTRKAGMDLLAEIKLNAAAGKEQITAEIENAIFLLSQEYNLNDYPNLLDPQLIRNEYNRVKAQIQSEIDRHALGVDRLEIINEVWDAFNFGDIADDNPKSIPSKIIKWLKTLHAVYTENANKIFSKSADQPLPNPNPTFQGTTIDQQKNIAKEHLAFMAGKSPIDNKPIMSEAQHAQMMNAVYTFIEHKQVPSIPKPIQTFNMPTFAVRYTFYRLSKELKNLKMQAADWVNLLHSLFHCFSNNDLETTRKKFSEKPPMYDVEYQSVKK